MKKTYTEIICILDRSGSMELLQKETIDGLNSFIDQQRDEDGLCNFSLLQFNHDLRLSINRKPIGTVAKLSLSDYKPFGYTALNDALGETLNQSLKIVSGMSKDERPDNILVYIITDGQDNCSRNYTTTSVRQLIEQLSNTDIWTFEFFGANINAFASAEDIGIKKENAHSWSFDKKGMDDITNYIALKTSTIRKNSNNL